MGACDIGGTYKAYDWKIGIEEIQEQAEAYYGHQEGYSGAENCVDFRYVGDFSDKYKTAKGRKELDKYIDARMSTLYKREGEIIKIGIEGYAIIKTKYIERKVTDTYERYLYKVKRPSVLLEKSPYGFEYKIIAEGTVAELKEKAHNRLRQIKYSDDLYIVKKDKIYVCTKDVKTQKNTTRRSDAKTLVLEIGKYRYYGWAPE